MSREKKKFKHCELALKSSIKLKINTNFTESITKKMKGNIRTDTKHCQFSLQLEKGILSWILFLCVILCNWKSSEWPFAIKDFYFSNCH